MRRIDRTFLPKPTETTERIELGVRTQPLGFSITSIYCHHPSRSIHPRFRFPLTKLATLMNTSNPSVYPFWKGLAVTLITILITAAACYGFMQI